MWLIGWLGWDIKENEQYAEKENRSVSFASVMLHLASHCPLLDVRLPARLHSPKQQNPLKRRNQPIRRPIGTASFPLVQSHQT